MSTILVPQPLHRPAPYVAYGTNAGHCYSSPIFIREVTGTTAFDSMDVRSYASNDHCGKLALYSQCATGNTLLVIYPEATSPHAYVQFGAACYSFNGTLTTTGTHPFTFAGSISSVASCTDAACTLADSNGGSYAYFDHQTNLQVNVRFEHLDQGVAHYGVLPAKTDFNPGLPEPGSTTVRFGLQATQHVTTVAGTGVLHFRLSPTPYAKALMRQRGSVYTAYPMGQHDQSYSVDVEPGDQIFLSAANGLGRLASSARGHVVSIRWVPDKPAYHLYDSGTVAASGVLRSIGLCGLANRQPYTFYGTLPADLVGDSPLNPGGFVTVQSSSGSEQLVIRSRVSGDYLPEIGLPWYTGNNLASPVTVRCYAARLGVDGHGEMDLWFDSTGTLPAQFKVDAYRALVFSGSNSYRITSQVGDTSRNSLQVINSTAGIVTPSVYAAPDGELITVRSSANTFDHAGKTFTRRASDPGLSYRIVEP